LSFHSLCIEQTVHVRINADSYNESYGSEEKRMKYCSCVNRRVLLKLGFGTAVSLFSGFVFSANKALRLARTPRHTEGPFYPLQDQADKDANLVQIIGLQGEAAGDRIEVRGRVLDKRGAPVSGVLVEIWHANKWGRYDHRRDRNSAPLDPNFQGWGQLLSSEDGSYSFQSIFPGIYPAAPDWKRPPHIHFKVSRRGFHLLTTQMYFPGQELNAKDLLLQRLPAAEQALLIAKEEGIHQLNGDPVARYIFDIVLRK